MIHFNNNEHAFKIAEAAGVIHNPAVDPCISRVSDTGELLGGITYTGFTHASVGMNCAGFHPNWINRSLLWVAFDYPFNQLGVNKVIAQVEAAKQSVLEFDLKIGFKEEARVKDVFLSGDVIVLGMYRAHCRWIRR